MARAEFYAESVRGSDVWTAREEPAADRALSLAAMAGAVGGALTGGTAALAAGAAYPVVYGGLGVLLGSALVAATWSLIARAWARR